MNLKRKFRGYLYVKETPLFKKCGDKKRENVNLRFPSVS